MDKFNIFFQSVDRLSREESRKNVVSFLKDQAVSLRSEPERESEIAYAIASLMATDFVNNLGEDDPLSLVFIIAGELEVNLPYNDRLREELIETIEAL